MIIDFSGVCLIANLTGLITHLESPELSSPLTPHECIAVVLYNNPNDKHKLTYFKYIKKPFLLCIFELLDLILMHHLHTVYSTLDNPPSTSPWTMGYIILGLFVCFCTAMAFGIGRNLKVTLNGMFKVNPFLAIIPPVVIFSLLYLNTDTLKIDVYRHDKALLNSNKLKVVEGTVEDYYPMSKDGHGLESFTVKGVEFHYSYWEEGRSGYHQAALYGGVIRPGLYVKIGYYYDGDRNAILKLETE